MGYLPPEAISETQFPKAWSKDLLTAVRMIEKQYNRIYPLVQYHPILKSTTPQTDFSTTVGAAGNTKFDPLYGEAVDATMTTVIQPHLSGEYKAANPEIYGIPVPIRARIFRGEIDVLLKEYGFDKTRELIVTIPTSVLDRAGVTMTEGDYFEWDGHPYEVKEVGRDEFWRNTNVQLYVTGACNAWRVGS
jgi:hypothetical protein